MKQKLLLKTMLLLCILVGGVSNVWGDSTTANVSISDYASTNKWTSGTAYSSITIDTYVSASGKSNGNNSKYYSSNESWRHYEGDSGDITISTTGNNVLKSITFTYANGNSGVIKYSGSNVSSGSACTAVEGLTSATFSVGHSSGTKNGNVQITAISVTYAPTHTLTYSATNGSIAGVVFNTSTAVASGASVAEGGKVTLTAAPVEGYSFTGWSVDSGTLSSSTDNPTTFTMGTTNATVTANFAAGSIVANPTFTIPSGTYNETKSVVINCETDGATIYYTTDGTDPTTSSSVYSSAISVTQTTTIKALAVKGGMTNSGVASATYTLKCATPTITVPSGAFLNTKEVTMSSSDGASIYYTIDGSEPTSSSTAYDPSNKPSISATTTLKAIATKSGWSDSEVATETFTKIVPKTVGEALTAIAALAKNGTIENQYVRGIVSTTGSISSGAVTYYISADGTTTNQLQVYKGKGIDGANFTAQTNLELGDEVVVNGTLKNYNGNTPEFDAGSQIISRVTKTAPTFSLDPTSKTLDAYSHETVDITLTTNTDGAITCESDDEDVATVALKSGNVYTITAKTEGTATITISSAASATYKPASATVEITVTDNRTDAGISFAKDAEEITWGESFTGQALTNDNSVAVEWSSTNEDVAIVDNTGAVTVLKAGTTEIKATFSGNATYKAAVASYTLTVNKANAGLSYTTTSFDIMLNDDTFEAPVLNNPNGLTVTYTSSNTDVATVNTTTGELSYVSSAVGTAKITATFVANDWYKGGSANYTINIIDPTVKGTKYNPYTVAEVKDGTATGSGIYVIGYIVGNYNAKAPVNPATGDTNLALADVSTETSGAKIIPVELPSGTIRTNWGPNSNNVIGYKVLLKGNAQSYFSVAGIKGTKEITTITVPVKLNASGYATFASTYALDFTDDSQFSAWQITDVTSSTINFSQIKSAVAAGTGVLLKGTASSTINIPVAATGTDISATNKLEGITTATAIAADTYFGLSGNKFVKVNAGTIRAGKALLPASAIPASARELTFVFEDETTGIADVIGKKADVSGNFFDLQGRKVAQPTKGLYIVNGKKVVIK